MTVPMMNVREMSVGVRDGLVLMAVGVGAGAIPGKRVLVLMMQFSRIVHVFMRMQQWFVLMLMAVALAQVQP